MSEGNERQHGLEARIESNEVIQRELETLAENIEAHIELSDSPLWMADTPARARMWDEFLADWKFIAVTLRSLREKIHSEHEFIATALQSADDRTLRQ